MTKLLCYENSDIYTFQSRILRVQDEGLLLAETYFYPEGGGQAADIGNINKVAVLHVQKIGQEIFHKVADIQGFYTGMTVHCKIDKDHRTIYKEQHTGQHIVSALMHTQFNVPTVSVHQGSEHTSIDFGINSLTTEQWKTLECQTNAVIASQKSVQNYILDTADAKQKELRKVPDIEETLRVVDIEGVDKTACGGLHANNTGQVKLAKFVKAEPHKGCLRSYWLFGQRAIDDYMLRFEAVERLCPLFSANLTTLVDTASEFVRKKTVLEQERNILYTKMAVIKAEDLIRQSKDSFVIQHFQDICNEDFLTIAKTIQDRQKNCFLSRALDSNKFQWVLAGCEPFPVDTQFLQDTLLPLFQGKGGGKPPFYQGVGENPEGLPLAEKVLQKLF